MIMSECEPYVDVDVDTINGTGKTDGRTKWKIANAPYIHKHKGRTRKKDCRIKCTPANGLRLRMLWLANARASQRDIVVWLLLSSSLFVVVWRTLADTPRYAVLYIVQHTLYLCTYVCLNKVEFCDTNFQCNRNFQKKLPCGIASVLLFWWALCHSQCTVLWHTYVYSCSLELITWQIWWFSSLGHGSVLRARHTICVFYNTSLSLFYIYTWTHKLSLCISKRLNELAAAAPNDDVSTRLIFRTTLVLCRKRR